MAALLEALETQAEARHLRVLGGFHPGPRDGAPEGCATLLMIGPAEPGFWPAFQASPEFSDGAPDPLDRWSKRMLGGWARELDARAVFPSDGPPYAPFIAWAKATGRVWNSPAGILVHDRAGLMVSYRGALALRDRLDLPAPPAWPCATCAGRPCLGACPVAALDDRGYDLAACHGYLDTRDGRSCLTGGCLVRRACPVSRDHGRLPEQSAFHMKAFHP